MHDLAVVICLDGCGTEYLVAAGTPNFDALGRSAWAGVCLAVVPTVTNVNHASILTGAFPSLHGITSNWYRDRSTGESRYMELSKDVLTETVFQKLAREDRKTALLTGKDKLCRLLAMGTWLSASAENAPPWLVDLVGPPPGLYTAEVNLWLLDAVLALLSSYPELDFIYATTTDYVTHMFAPEDEEAQRHFSQLDQRIGALAERLEGRNLVITADHGMTAKSVAIDPSKILREAGISVTTVPIIRDRHVIHHQNLSGSAYLYLEEPEATPEACKCLEEVAGVEEVLTREEAVEAYHLHPDRIGDLMILADAHTVFGDLPSALCEVRMRSHGSVHERVVPMIGRGPRLKDKQPRFTAELMPAIFPSLSVQSDGKDGSEKR